MKKTYLNRIRNFCIIAHIDAGKSTLADRFLELAGAVSRDKLKNQHLDQMDLERERGITIKLQPVRLEFEDYILNLVDTPGHVDFSYEVSRTLAVVEGAVLLVDAARGVQAQTLSVLEMALAEHLAIIPAINKIDLANAQIEKCRQQIQKLLGDKTGKIYEISAKTGAGVPALLQAIIQKVPAPRQPRVLESSTPGVKKNALRALVFDSHYDRHRGVVVYIRVFDGKIKAGERIKFLSSQQEDKALEVGIFSPTMQKTASLQAGEIGYVMTDLKSIEQAQIGDTLTFAKDTNITPLPGYQKPQPMVFASVFPYSQKDFASLSQALQKLSLNDASFKFKTDHSPILGAGFEIGVLGLLHLEILLERIRREYKLEILATTPSPRLKIIRQTSPDGQIQTQTIRGVWQLPSQDKISQLQEPYLKIKVITPQDYYGKIMKLAQNFQAKLIASEYLGQDRLELNLRMPLKELLRGFYDQLKSVSAGFASLSYQFDKYQPSNSVKLDVKIADELILPLSALAPPDKAYARARNLALKLKKIIPRANFEIRIQILTGGKIIASEKIPPLKKDVTAGLYGGDVTRKRKLLEKQKKGKKRMKHFGRVKIPSEVFIKMLAA